MIRKLVLPGHVIGIDRRDIGASHHGGYHRFYTTVDCSCGWKGEEIEVAPTRGGSRIAIQAFHHHLMDVISRNARFAARTALLHWQLWQPGDGTAYQVRILIIGDGPDYKDRVLLVNLTGKTWAFQYPTAPYRREQSSPREWRVHLSGGVRPDIWAAVTPLLTAEGAL